MVATQRANPSQEGKASKPPTLADVAIACVEANPDNPREFDNETADDTLTVSMAQLGLIAPIVVRPLAGRPGRYQLVAGERRFRAAKAAKWKTIPALVRDGLSQTDALSILAAENLCRKNFHAIEKARVLQKLCTPEADGGGGLTRLQAAKLFGKSKPWCENILRLLNLPEAFQRMVAAGELPETTARALATYADRPEVLAAVKTDMASTPYAWRTRVDAERSLKIIVEALDRGDSATPLGARATKPRSAPAIELIERQTAVAKRSPASRPHDPEPEPYNGEIQIRSGTALAADVQADHAVDTICFHIKQLTESAHCDEVQQALDDQRGRLKRAKNK